MLLGLFGTGRAADARRASLQRLGRVPSWTSAGLDDQMDWDAHGPPPLDALFVAGSPAERAFAVRMALRHGVPVLAEWPPAASRRELHTLVAMSEEAGVELAVARTIRYLPVLADAPADARLVVATRTVAPGRALLPTLPDVLDVVRCLAGQADLRRLDAAAVRDLARPPRAFGMALRFAGGTQALVSVAVATDAPPAFTVTAHSRFDTLHAVLMSDAAAVQAALDRETTAFLDALPGPSVSPSAHDALDLLRLVERVAARLR